MRCGGGAASGRWSAGWRRRWPRPSSGTTANVEEPESRQRRLETDADAVQVQTIHAAKGLQWPVVLVPYAWDVSTCKPPIPVFHGDPTRRRAPGAADRRRRQGLPRLRRPLAAGHGRGRRRGGPAAVCGADPGRASPDGVVGGELDQHRHLEAQRPHHRGRPHAGGPGGGGAAATIAMPMLDELPAGGRVPARTTRTRSRWSGPGSSAGSTTTGGGPRSRRCRRSTRSAPPPRPASSRPASDEIRPDESNPTRRSRRRASRCCRWPTCPAAPASGRWSTTCSSTCRSTPPTSSAAIREALAPELRYATWDFDPDALVDRAGGVDGDPARARAGCSPAARPRPAPGLRRAGLRAAGPHRRRHVSLRDIGTVMLEHLPADDPYRAYAETLHGPAGVTVPRVPHRGDRPDRAGAGCPTATGTW